MLHQVRNAKRIERVIPGLGCVLLEDLMGQRFARIDGVLTSLRQLRADALAVDSGHPTSLEKDRAALATLNAANATSETP
jgi:hypothetical protein